MELGKRITELRKKQGMTQEQLADHLSTTRQAISKWELDKSEPDLNSLIKMGALFGVSMDELLLGTQETEETVPEPEAVSVTPDSQNARKYRNCRVAFAAVLLLGLYALVKLPHIAQAYQNYEIATYSWHYGDVRDYYTEWPILGVVIAGIAACLGGWRGIIWANGKLKDL